MEVEFQLSVPTTRISNCHHSSHRVRWIWYIEYVQVISLTESYIGLSNGSVLSISTATTSISVVGCWHVLLSYCSTSLTNLQTYHSGTVTYFSLQCKMTVAHSSYVGSEPSDPSPFLVGIGLRHHHSGQSRDLGWLMFGTHHIRQMDYNWLLFPSSSFLLGL